MATRSKACVCFRWLAVFPGSNPTRGVDVSLLWVLCVVRLRSVRRADHSSRGGPGPLAGCRATGKKNNFTSCFVCVCVCVCVCVWNLVFRIVGRNVSEGFLKFVIVCAVNCTELLIYRIEFTRTKMCTTQTLVSLLYVSARHRCHHQGVRSVANVATWKWSVAK
jgi:hypothetical protein